MNAAILTHDDSLAAAAVKNVDVETVGYEWMSVYVRCTNAAAATDISLGVRAYDVSTATGALMDVAAATGSSIPVDGSVAPVLISGVAYEVRTFRLRGCRKVQIRATNIAASARTAKISVVLS
jgi:hypothetical protein